MSDDLLVNNLRQQFPFFAAEPLCYLDSAATAQLPQCVLDALQDFEIHRRGNVGRGSHRQADRAMEAYHKARLQVRDYLHADSEREVIFTAGTTAAINAFADSVASTFSAGDEIVLSQLEHHSNLLPWRRAAQKYQLTIRIIEADSDGRLALSQLPQLMNARTRLIAVTHASNVTGAITDVAAIVAAAKTVSAMVMLDGAQMAAHGPLDVQALGVDAYVFSGHKCYGPNGIGVLWGRESLLASLPPFAVGGGMVGRIDEQGFECLSLPARLEAGTPAIAQAVGLGAALGWLSDLDWPAIERYQRQLLNRLISVLIAIPGLQLLGPNNDQQRLGLLSFALKGCHPHDLCHVLAEQGVAVRGGHLCAQPLLAASGHQTVTRISLGLYNNQTDVEQLIAALAHARRVLL